MFVHSSSRFQKLSNTDIDNLTYKEARQIANYARSLINKRINYLNSIGLGDANEDLLYSMYDFMREKYIIEPIPQNEDISFYKNFIKEMKINYKETSADEARKKLGIINITLKKLKYLYIKNGGSNNSDSETQTFVDEELDGDWDIYWNSFIPKKNIDNVLNNKKKYTTLSRILEDLKNGEIL